ncbi:MAG: hypothetical protein D3909_04355, partial [Candidatus Electrothrix sp. ATG1]|nr:hypothetical protein [Candidatus Electrothrix sp. ATG1]
MKKIFFWFCFLGMAGVLFYFLFRPAPPAPEFRQNYYADFLPDDTVAVVGLYNMKGLSEDFPETAFGQFLSKPIIHEVLKESGATDQDLKGYDAFYDIIA